MLFAGRRPLFARGTQIGDQQAAQGSSTTAIVQQVSVADLSLQVKPSKGMLQHGKGTVEDPHVFVGMIRDHRGLSDADRTAYQRVRRRLLHKKEYPPAGTSMQSWARKLHEVETGARPFEVFENLADGKTWGKYYDGRDDVLTIKPVPVDRAWYEHIGAAIVWFGEQAWEALKVGCDKLQWATSGQKDDVAYALISVAASPGAAAAVKSKVEIAKKICRGVEFVDGVFGGREPAEPLGEDWDRPETRVTSTRRSSSTPLPAVYPPNAFAVYDPRSSSFRILVPQETP